MALSNVTIEARLKATLSKSLSDGSAPSVNYTQGYYDIEPSDADLLYNNRHTVGNGSNVELDLAGSLEDALGTALTFAKVYAIYIRNRSTTSGDVVHVGINSAAIPIFGATADYFIIGANGVFLVTAPADGWTVTATTGDILEIANPGSNDIACDVSVLGKAPA